jgi:hypothetical protein
VGLATIALLGAGAGAGLALVELAIRRSDAGAALVLGLVLLSEIPIIQDFVLLTNPFRVGIGDALFAVLLTAGIARLLRRQHLTMPQRLLLIFGIIVAWALIRGIGQFGIATATNEARRFLRYFAAALYFSTVEVEPNLLRRLGQIWLTAAVAFSVISVVRWVANAMGVAGGFLGDGSDLRVVNSAETLIIAQGALIALPLLRERSRGLVRYLAPALLACVVLLQHRTVWIGAVVGTVYLLSRERALTPRVIAGLSVGLVMFAALIVAVFDDADVDVADQLTESSQSTGTFEWRVEGWRVLLSESGPTNLSETVVGQPFGKGWDRAMYGTVVEVSPHNFYIESYLRVGVLGLFVIIALYGISLRATGEQAIRVTSPPLALSGNVLKAMIVVQLLYFLSYAPDVTQAMLLGLGCAAASSPARASVSLSLEG